MNHNSEHQNDNSNVVFIGDKPISNYIKSANFQFYKEISKELIIKSRGKFISKAVDVAEIIKRNFSEKNARVKSISIGSEKFESNEKTTNISTIEIIIEID